MFDNLELTSVLDLQQRSFALLKWVREALDKGSLSFAVVHQTTDSTGAAEEWITRHLANLPHDIRPRAEQIPSFSRLFVSYLTTSYRLSPQSTQLVSDCGCYCSWCAYLRSSPRLELRTPGKKDLQTAKELKRIYLRSLVVEAEIESGGKAVERVVELANLHKQVALATWASEMLRRTQFASQGEGVLALWREFAWTNNTFDRKFRLSAAEVIKAEQQVVAAMRKQPSS